MQCDRLMFFISSRRRHTISDRDWSSDVCSSDLEYRKSLELDADLLEAPLERRVALEVLAVLVERRRADRLELAPREGRLEDRGRVDRALEIGRASCRERVEISVVAVSLKKKTDG